MATVTSSLERSLQNCSLGSTNDQDSSPTMDLNPHISLPYHWEQCLDLKTGNVYYINWKTGEQVKEVPRTAFDFYSEEEEDDDDEDGDSDSSYDYSGESSSDSSPTSYSRYNQIYRRDQGDNNNNKSGICNDRKERVLVVAGCKSCLMYFMVPKQDPICPKCNGQLLHFEQSENGSV